MEEVVLKDKVLCLKCYKQQFCKARAEIGRDRITMTIVVENDHWTKIGCQKEIGDRHDTAP